MACHTPFDRMFEGPGSGAPAASRGLVLVDYRALDGGPDGVAIVDADPASSAFGTVVSRLPLGEGVTPHHVYFDPAAKNVWTTTLGPPYLYRLELEEGFDGLPRLVDARPVDVGANQMGEDMWFSPDGSEYYVTFLGGHGEAVDGSVGRFDAETDTLIEELRHSAEGPPLKWPHGISGDASRGQLLVTNNESMDGVAGDSVTAIDLATFQPTKTWMLEADSAPVEVMLTRGQLPPFAIVTTMRGGDLWVAPWDEAAQSYGTFTKRMEGSARGLGVALELYVKADPRGDPELYVTFADPGVVNVYGLEALPELTLRRTLPAAPGAHHLVFFESEGRTVMVVQNNLIDLEGLNDGRLMAVDAGTGELLGEIDLPATEGILPESIEWAFGHGHDLHHGPPR